MRKIVTGALAALSLVGAAAGTATPAAAQAWHGGYGRGGYGHGGYGGYYHGGYRGWGPGAAVGAGLVGLAVGASLASPGYGYGYGYGRPYYGGGYYAPSYGYGYGYGCRIVGRWGPWGYHHVRACY